MAYLQLSPLPVAESGTGLQTFTAYAVLCGGTTSTAALQQVSGLGTSGQVLTSNGSGILPSWQNAPTDATDVVFQTLSSDPGSGNDGDVWFNTTANAYKGFANGAAVTFDYTT